MATAGEPTVHFIAEKKPKVVGWGFRISFQGIRSGGWPTRKRGMTERWKPDGPVRMVRVPL